VCADAFAEGLALSRELGRRGARMILSPCAWAVEKGHDNADDPYGKTWTDCYSPVAREFGLWFLGASNVGVVRTGPWRGRRCIGCSLAVGPDGRVAARGPYGVRAEAIVIVNMDEGYSLTSRTTGDLGADAASGSDAQEAWTTKVESSILVYQPVENAASVPGTRCDPAVGGLRRHVPADAVSFSTGRYRR